MIAEKHYEDDEFTHDPSNPDKVPAKWMTTQKMIDIFASNKVIGAKLAMNGVYKSNTKRVKYNKIQTVSRVHSGYICALAHYQLLLSATKLEKNPLEDLIHPVFRTVISKGGNPKDFGRVTKIIFPLIYDPNCEKGWSEELANEYLGDMAEEIKEILLDHKPKGFENASAHSRALNLHKETSTIIENLWNGQDLPESFDWLEIKKYYTDLNKLNLARGKLDILNKSNIHGMHIDDVMKLDYFEIDDKKYTFKEALLVLKKQYYDLNSNNEQILGAMTERWKDYKTLLFLYHPAEYKDEINSLNIWGPDFTLQQKIDSFKEFMINIIRTYQKIHFKDWIEARTYARENNYPDNLKNPVEDSMSDNLQRDAYLDAMLSHDLTLKHNITLALMNQFVWYQSITEEDIMMRKGWLLDDKHAAPTSYKNWLLSTANICKLHDNLVTGDMNCMATTKKLCTADYDVYSEEAYAKVVTCFKFNRKMFKIDQYLEGQLVKDDERLLGRGEDGVPSISKLTLQEKLNAVAGDDVVMFPQYSMMQKSTKRNSCGIHTIPSRNQCKGVISAPPGEILVYTDISGMELKGICAISGDQVMDEFFRDGKDIYVEAAKAYYIDYLKKDYSDDYVKKHYRPAFKQGTISAIYTAGAVTLATGFDCKVYEVSGIEKAIFDKFPTLKNWQQEQIQWNKANRTRIRTYLGDIRTTFEENHKQTRQAVNLDVQGTCSLVATSAFNNILRSAHEKRMYLAPVVIVHDALIAYAKAGDIEKIHQHYEESFFKFADENYGFYFPFEIDIAVNYYDKVTLGKNPDGIPRRYTLSGTNKSSYQILKRCIEAGKKIIFHDGVDLEEIQNRISPELNVYEQYVRAGGNACFDMDFSYNTYDIEFID